MLNVELKPLVKKLNPVCTSVLESAVGLCMSQTHYEITLEHWCVKLLDDKRTDLYNICQSLDIDVDIFKRILLRNLESFDEGNSAKPTFSLMLLEIIQDAWVIGSINYNMAQVRSGLVFLALLSNRPLLSSMGITELFGNVSKQNIIKDFYKLCGNSHESSTALGEGSAADKSANKLAQADSAIANFCEDLTEKAKTDKIDPVFGREDEIEQMMDIFCRRRKNNPILVGEAGVGKTAVVEGLALRVAQGDVPSVLQGVRIISLDLALLEAGASIKGEFEKRLTAVIDEIKSSEVPIILFIDEAHRLIGGGQGGNDAANILKPALSRGELRTVAATTWKEYKQYFEKDAAMTRRFQLVTLDEPNDEVTTLILRGLKEHYVKSHNVTIRDDAIQAIVQLSSRYITGRYQPDKSVDLLDTCAARVKVSLSSKPSKINHIDRELAGLDREQKAILDDQLRGIEIKTDRLDKIDDELIELTSNRKVLMEKWEQEKSLIKDLMQVQSLLLKTNSEVDEECLETENVESEEVDPNADQNDEKESAHGVDNKFLNLSDEDLVGQREKLKSELKEIQSDDSLVSYEVDPDCVAKVVSSWTGVPLGKVLRDEANSILLLNKNLQTRIKGQNPGVDRISTFLKLAKAGLSSPEQPMGIFLLVGPSGVGKTETALTIADTIFGGEDSIVSINMSEFQEKHTISRLIGSPPGYVGYGEGGMLTEAVRKRPYSVVLLDEVEKASLDVLNLFYQVFDKGSLTDGEGREIDFSNTVIILTSNLATNEITEVTLENPNANQEDVLTHIRPLLSQWFKPALLARTTIVPYYILSQEALCEIVKLKLDKLAKQLKKNNGITLEFSDDVLKQVASRCTDYETGARNVDHILKGNIMPKLSQVILENMCEDEDIEKIKLGLDKDSCFEFKVEKAST
ncbi:MAG: type VI secretion system protein VasG [Francisellaceae bacterium]|jgi:type VI secretion system protein VasG